MSNIKMLGIIKWFKKKKGYGYIIGADDESYYFELINCVNMNERFEEGDKVMFIPNFVDLEYAIEVEKIAEGVGNNE